MRKRIDIPVWYKKNRIVELRKNFGFNQQHVADKIDCVLKTYQNYEQGHNYPTLEYATKLAELYGVSIDYLFGRSDCICIENDKIKEITGLEDSSIETLKNLRKDYYFEKDLEILNYIMSDTYTFRQFLNCIKDYIATDYTIPLHPELHNKNIKYVENLDIETDNSILVNHERRMYVGKKSGEYNGEPLYAIKTIPISQLSTLNLLWIQEMLQIWKQNYKENAD